MADSPERPEAMFPKLTRVQIDRLRPVGRPRQFAPGEYSAARTSSRTSWAGSC
jgi:hypothetical protein